MNHRTSRVLTGALLLGACGIASAEKTVISIESWRMLASDVWNSTLIPAFEAANPDIEVEFLPTLLTKAPDYKKDLAEGLDAGTAGDLITCQPFDNSLALFKKGHLAPLQDQTELDLSHFPDTSKAAWSTDDRSEIFCVPMASVIHGFLYNKDIFANLGLAVPETEAEFYALLDKIKKDGQYIPLAFGTKDAWATVTLGLNNSGPAYWGGEAGRVGLLSGENKFTDKQFQAALHNMASWQPYLANGFQAQGYKDSQAMFSQQRAAIYPTGSWEILTFQKTTSLNLGVFPPPKLTAAGDCYISDHTDIAMGLNANSKNKAAAMKFLRWVASAEFAEMYTNAFPGFYTLSDHAVKVQNPLSKEYLAMRDKCKSTIRLPAQILDRGEVTLSQKLNNLVPRVINGSMSATAAAKEAQGNIDSWYQPDASWAARSAELGEQ